MDTGLDAAVKALFDDVGTSWKEVFNKAVDETTAVFSPFPSAAPQCPSCLSLTPSSFGPIPKSCAMFHLRSATAKEEQAYCAGGLANYNP